MNDSLAEIAPAGLWHHFYELSTIPRPSGREQAAQLFVKRLAGEASVPWREDAMGNLVLYMSGEGGPVVAVQAHLDMVCEKEPGVEHDFEKDPIHVEREGDRVFARGTTLGADNGIGAAACLALLTESGLRHGPLELIFTVQEETGLHGAVGFDAALSSAQMLINLDSEDPAFLTVGCAGGSAVEIRLDLEPDEVPEGWVSRWLSVAGARGGHSGVDIHLHRANAIKVLAAAMSGIGDEYRIVGLEGGSAHNVIPRDAEVTFAIPASRAEEVEQSISELRRELSDAWEEDEPDLSLTLSEGPPLARALSAGATSRLSELLANLPHGVLSMSEQFAGKVQTSANLARVEVAGSSGRILASVRSFSAPSQEQAQSIIEAQGKAAGGTMTVEMGYPGWEPDPGSRLLKIAQEQYLAVHGRPAGVEVLHAGLECGVLVSKKPGTEAISFGPLITGAHSPSEQVTVSTVESMWKLLVGILSEVKRESS